MSPGLTMWANAAIAASMAFPCFALAAPLKVDTTKSHVGAEFKQMNVPVEGKFTHFTAQIDYQATQPETSKAALDIDLPSFDLGDPEFNQEVLKKEWFNGAQFPKASFVSNTIKPVGCHGQAKH